MAQERDPESSKYMTKGDWRHVRSAVKDIQECMTEEKKQSRTRPERDRLEKPLSVATVGPR